MVVAVVVGGAAFGDGRGKVAPVVRCSGYAVAGANGGYVAVAIVPKTDIAAVFVHRGQAVGAGCVAVGVGFEPFKAA